MNFQSSLEFNKYPLTSFFDHSLETRRTDKGNLRHTFHDILLIVLTSVLCGLEKYSLMVQLAENELEWFKKYGEFKNGIPCAETIRRFLSALDIQAFQECYSNWISSICNLDEVKSIAIDGKTIRGASTKSDTNSISPHILTAWASDQGFCLGQIRVDDKSNEITAIPELIKNIVVKDSVLTIDAMGCQKQIVNEIINQQADYIIAVKGNQKSLEQAIKDTVLLEKPNNISISEDVGHGRVEKRTCSVYSNLSHLDSKDLWRALEQFVKIESEIFCKSTGKTTSQIRYYITSLKEDAAKINQLIRNHWSIENQLHWVLDVSFNEDQSRKRAGNSAENFNLIFKSALVMLKNDNSMKKPLSHKKLQVLINKKYREKIMGF